MIFAIFGSPISNVEAHDTSGVPAIQFGIQIRLYTNASLAKNSYEKQDWNSESHRHTLGLEMEVKMQ